MYIYIHICLLDTYMVSLPVIKRNLKRYTRMHKHLNVNVGIKLMKFLRNRFNWRENENCAGFGVNHWKEMWIERQAYKYFIIFQTEYVHFLWTDRNREYNKNKEY